MPSTFSGLQLAWSDRILNYHTLWAADQSFKVNILDSSNVLIGTIFLCVALLRLICNFFNNTRFSGFELAIWYWHFVDVVWLFVFSGIYCWGNA